MSEFTCAQGHDIIPSIGYCEDCGGRAVRMDGKSNAELRRIEEIERREEKEDECGGSEESE